MSRRNLSFTTSDGVTLAGVLTLPSPLPTHTLPILILSHGFSCIKEMSLLSISTSLTSTLPLACFAYDQRGFGESSTLPTSPRSEIIPSIQISDLSDAITYVSTLPEINKAKIGVWGYSYSGGHVLHTAAYDRRVNAVIALAPCIDGYEQMGRMVPLHQFPTFFDLFAADREARMKGEQPISLPVVNEDPMGPSCLPSRESHAFFSQWDKEKREGSTWVNQITVKSAEALMAYSVVHALPRITPTPVLVGIGSRDTNGAVEYTMRHYAKISEPKEYVVVDADHYEMVTDGKARDELHKKEVEFLKRTLCA